MKFRVTLASILCLLASDAFAASRVWISEFSTLASTNSGGSPAPAAALPSLTDQAPLDISVSVQTSQTFTAQTRLIQITCEVQCAIKAGGTATTSSLMLPAGIPVTYGVLPSMGGVMATVGGLHLQIYNNVNPAYLGFASAYYQGGTGVTGNTWDDTASGLSKSATFTPGATYTMRVFVEAPWVYYMLLDANGNLIAKQLVFSPTIGDYIGRWFFIETFGTPVTYKSVWARKKSGNTLSIREFLGGVDSTPIGIRDPAPARFTSLHLGPASVTPSGVFGIVYDGNPSYPPPGVSSYANGNGVWEVKGVAAGTGAELWLTANGPLSCKVVFDSNLAFAIYDNDGLAWFGKRWHKSPYMMALPQAANDAAAATAGVGVGEMYANGSVMMQRQA